MSNARELVRVAARSLDEAPVELRAGAVRYEWWFGAYSSSRYARVQKTFEEMGAALDAESITFDCSCNLGGIYDRAYAFADIPGRRLNFCPAFWRTSALGTDSQAGVIVHELSHFPDLGGSRDHVYGQRLSHSLAESDPERAIGNADSFEYFAENTPELPMPTPAEAMPVVDPEASAPSMAPDLEPEPDPEPVEELPVVDPEASAPSMAPDIEPEPEPEPTPAPVPVPTPPATEAPVPAEPAAPAPEPTPPSPVPATPPAEEPEPIAQPEPDEPVAPAPPTPIEPTPTSAPEPVETPAPAAPPADDEAPASPEPMPVDESEPEVVEVVQSAPEPTPAAPNPFVPVDEPDVAPAPAALPVAEVVASGGGGSTDPWAIVAMIVLVGALGGRRR